MRVKDLLDQKEYNQSQNLLFMHILHITNAIQSILVRQVFFVIKINLWYKQLIMQSHNNGKIWHDFHFMSQSVRKFPTYETIIFTICVNPHEEIVEIMSLQRHRD